MIKASVEIRIEDSIPARFWVIFDPYVYEVVSCHVEPFGAISIGFETYEEAEILADQLDEERWKAEEAMEG